MKRSRPSHTATRIAQLPLLRDVRALLSQRHNTLEGTSTFKLSAYFLAALLLQIAYWYLAVPGPHLLGDAPRTLASALSIVGWTFGLFFVVPLLLMALFRDAPRRVVWGLGDVRFGVLLTLIGGTVAAGLMYIGATDAALQATYPWAGAWPGRSGGTLAAWFGLRLVYYVSFEFFFRGFMLRGLAPFWGLGTALWVQALSSVLIHVGSPLPELLGAIPAGLLFGVVAVRGRSLLWPILLHLIIGFSTDIFSLLHQGLLLQ